MPNVVFAFEMAHKPPPWHDKLDRLLKGLRALEDKFGLQFTFSLSNAQGSILRLEASAKLEELLEWWDPHYLVPACLHKYALDQRTFVLKGGRDTTVADLPKHIPLDSLQKAVSYLLDGAIKARKQEYPYSQPGSEERLKAAFDWYPKDVPYAESRNLETSQCLAIILGMAQAVDRKELSRFLHKWTVGSDAKNHLFAALRNATRSAEDAPGKY